MTSTFDEIVANFDGETTESFVVQDAEVIDDLPAGTRFKWGPTGLTWTICDGLAANGEVSRTTAKHVLNVSGAGGVMLILNPEILGEFTPLPETEPGFEELVGDLARKVFDAIGAERMTEALESLLPTWMPEVGQVVAISASSSPVPGWLGARVEVLAPPARSGNVRVRMAHGAQRPDGHGSDWFYWPLDKLAAIAESVTVVDEPSPKRLRAQHRRSKVSLSGRHALSLGLRIGYWPCLGGPFVALDLGTHRWDLWWGRASYRPGASR